MTRPPRVAKEAETKNLGSRSHYQYSRVQTYRVFIGMRVVHCHSDFRHDMYLFVLVF
jgi:hypothetical protein